MNDSEKIGFIMQLLLRGTAAASDGIQAGANLAVTIPGVGYGIAMVIPMVAGILGIFIFGMWFLLLPGRSRNGSKKMLVYMLMVIDCFPFLSTLPVTSLAVNELIKLSQPESSKSPGALETLGKAVFSR